MVKRPDENGLDGKRVDILSRLCGACDVTLVQVVDKINEAEPKPARSQCLVT